RLGVDSPKLVCINVSFPQACMKIFWGAGIVGAGTGIARGFGTDHALSRTAEYFPVFFGVSFGVFFFRLFPSKGWSP
ncbi:MAG TPA: hypothetical protein PKH24_21755, partial [Sedimentisphaerales bacterium]|nr:hypothetical protein [Sedimentisphaerales bacterium]